MQYKGPRRPRSIHFLRGLWSEIHGGGGSPQRWLGARLGARAGARGGSDPVRTTRGPPWPVFRAPAARAPPRGLAWPRSAAGARCSRSASARRAGASGGGGCAGYAGPRDTRPTSSAKRGAPPASRARPAPRNVRPRRAHAPPPRSARSWRTARAAGQLGWAAGSPHVWRAGCPPPDVFGRPARMPGHTPRRLCSMAISGTSGAAAAPRRALRRRSGARKIVRGMRRRTAHVTPCIRARAWMLEPLPSLFQ